jgi:hypothetical protein
MTLYEIETFTANPLWFFGKFNFFKWLEVPMLKRSMIHDSYVYSYPETLAASGFQENLKNCNMYPKAGVKSRTLIGN